jgi:hypothetical protein
MPTSFFVPASALAQTETLARDFKILPANRSPRDPSPVFRGLMFALLAESLLAATVCASYFGWHRLLHR